MQFILPRDKARYFRFAAIQSAFGAALLADFGHDPQQLATLFVYDEGRLLDRSEAVLAIAGHLSPPWRWLRLARWLPVSWRDGLYDVIAAHRYAWFGRRPQCILPDDAWRDRFIALVASDAVATPGPPSAG